MSLSSVPSASVLIRVIKPDGLISSQTPTVSYGGRGESLSVF